MNEVKAVDFSDQTIELSPTTFYWGNAIYGNSNSIKPVKDVSFYVKKGSKINFVADEKTCTFEIYISGAENKNLRCMDDETTTWYPDKAYYVQFISYEELRNSSKTSELKIKTTPLVNKINLKNVTLHKNTSTSVLSSIEPSDAYNKQMTWSSSNTSVATVDGSGNVKAINPGTATITAKATYSDNVSASCTVTVPDFTYTASDNKITAYCAEHNNSCSVFPNGFMFILSAKDAKYTGEPYLDSNVVFTRPDGDITGASPSGPVYYSKYTESEKVKTSTSDKSGAAKEGGAPKNVGTYYATMTLGTATAVKEFNISPVDQAVTVNMPDYKYGETPSIPSLSASEIPDEASVTYYYNTTGIVDTQNDKEWKDITNRSLIPGTYYIYATYDATQNYNSGTTAVKAFEVKGKNMQELNYVKVKYIDDGKTVSSAEKTYDGKDFTIEVDASKIPDDQDASDTKATIKYMDSEGSYTLNKAPSYSQVKVDDSGEATSYTISYKVTALGYYDYTDTAQISIKPKKVNAKVTASDKTYNGKTSATVKAEVTEGLVGDDELTITGMKGVFVDENGNADKNVSLDSDKNPVAKTVKVDAENALVKDASGKVTYNYSISYPKTATAIINPLVASLKWSEPDLHYNGEERTVTADVSNACSDDSATKDTFTIKYKGNKETKITTENQAVETTYYTAKVTDLGNDNYLLPDDPSLKWTITRLNKTATLTGTKGSEGWYTGDITLSAGEGYKVKVVEDAESQVSKDDSDWSDSITLSAQGQKTVYYFVMEESSGALSEVKSVDYKLDKAQPAGTITIGSSSYDTEKTDTSYKHFEKDSLDIDVSGTDVNSGIANIEYQLADAASALTEAGWEQAKLTQETDSTRQGTFTINANVKGSIFARITDGAGNSTIINSDKVVVYTDAVATAASVTYPRKSAFDKCFTVKVNGNTVASIKNGDTLLTEDTDYAVVYDEAGENATILLKNAYLNTADSAVDSLKTGTYNMTISYNPYGVALTDSSVTMQDTEFKLLVEKSKTSLISDISDVSKDADGAAVDHPGFITTNACGGTKNADGTYTVAQGGSYDETKVTFEYKKKGAADSTYDTTAPSANGRYVVRITVAEDDNYEAVTSSAEFWIHDSLMEETVSDTSFTYDGSNKGIAVAVKDSKTNEDKADAIIEYGSLDANKKIIYSTTPTTYKEAGQYTIYYRITAEGYETITDTATLTIAPKPVTFTWGNTDFIYNGKNQKPEASVNGLAEGDRVDVTVSGQQIDVNTVENPIYTAQVVALSNSNYTWNTEEASASTSYTISPKSVQVKLSAAGKVYDKTTKADLTGTVTEGLVGDDALTITGVGTFKQASAGRDIVVIPGDNNTSEVPDYSSMTILGVGSTKDYNYSYYFDISDLKADISKADRQIKITDVKDPVDLKFKTDDNADGNKDSYTGMTIEYKKAGQSDDAYTVLDDSTKPDKCGTYLVKITIPEDDNYEESSGLSKFFVAHDWTGEWQVVKAATATSQGLKVKYCKNDCGEKISASIDKLNTDGSSGGSGSSDGSDSSTVGSLEKSVQTENGSLITSAQLHTEKTDIAEDSKIITDANKTALLDGSINVIVNLQISKTEKEALLDSDMVDFAEAAEEAFEEIGELTGMEYFDIDLFKIVQTKNDEGSVTGEKIDQITKTDNHLNISIDIPVSLKAPANTLRTYKVLRLHDGDVDLLETTYDEAAQTLAFDTDRFSTYAIAYSDKYQKEPDSGKNDGSSGGSKDSTSGNSSSSTSSSSSSGSKSNGTVSSGNTKENLTKDLAAGSTLIADVNSGKNKSASTGKNSKNETDTKQENMDDSSTIAENEKSEDTVKDASDPADVSEGGQSTVDAKSSATQASGLINPDCKWHFIIAIIALLSLLVAAILGRKNKKYIFIAGLVSTILNIIFAIAGSCLLDWILLLAGIVLLLVLALCMKGRRNAA